MTTVLTRFSDSIAAGDAVYEAQACAAEMSDGRWEGWIEFIPADGGPPLRTPRETTQPNERDAEYWASGLTRVYLDGALERARQPVIRAMAEPAEALFDGPAPAYRVVDASAPAPEAMPLSSPPPHARGARRRPPASSER